MTLFSTITYGRPPSILAKPAAAVALALAMAIGVGAGLMVSSITGTSAGEEFSRTSALTHEEFLRVNTAELDALVATREADAFLIRNVDSFPGFEVVPDRHKVSTFFAELNTVLGPTVLAGAIPLPPSPVEVIGASEPHGYPNYALLKDYLDAGPSSGPR